MVKIGLTKTAARALASVLPGILAGALIAALAGPAAGAEPSRYDLVVYGGTSGGVAAAVQGARMGKSVVLIEPSRHLGGLSSGGLGATDIGNKMAIGGLAREFYGRIHRHYSDPAVWTTGSLEQYRTERPTVVDGDTMWTFEPKVAARVFRDMLSETSVTVVLEERLDLKNGVRKEDTRIRSIRMESGREFAGAMFIDATYEGDLMAKAGVSHTIGREPNSAYGETLNGVQVANSINHQFKMKVDPYVEPGNPSSGLLPGIEPGPPPPDGTGDHRVQAYCYRLCTTNVPENRLPWPKPDDYDPMRFELLLRNFEAGDHRLPLLVKLMPNGKTDSNNRYAISTDFIGANYDYPAGDYATRDRIIRAHQSYTKGLMWTLANNPRVPEEVRRYFQEWGLCRDEFADTDHWPHQLYVREARRMKSDYVMTEHDCRGTRRAPDPVGMGAYQMDSHNTQRYVDATGFVRNEGNIEVRVPRPYPISYRSVVPRAAECANLLVPVCLSASHIAYGSIRMEPVFMVLGQSCATAAALALDQGVPVQELDYRLLRRRLEKDGQVLEIAGAPAGPADSLTTPVLKLAEVKKIWDGGPHNAFTDLVRYRGRLLCAFREGGGHVPADHSGDGKIRVLESEDGATWASVALLERDGIDLRDPKLSVTPDGRLMLVVAGSVYEKKKFLSRKCYVSFFTDPRTPGELTTVEIDPRVSDETDWLWRITWHDGKAWGVVYNKGRFGRAAHLVSSTDGVRYDLVTSLDLKDFPNECSIVFEPDGAMVIVARRDAGDRMGMIGRAAAPYTEWTWNRMNTALGGPALCRLKRGTLLLGTREPGRAPKTVLGTVALDGTFTKLLEFPSGGDTSYPGLVLEGRTLWMSYYSSHEGKSSIYLARMEVR